MFVEEFVEFRHKLFEIAKGKETAIQSPIWPCNGNNRFAGWGFTIVSFTADEDHTLVHCLLATNSNSGKPINGRLRDTVGETEAKIRESDVEEQCG